MISIRLQDHGHEKVRKFLELLGDAPESKPMRNLIGVAVSDLTRDHLYRKDREPNRLGGRKTHYYRAAGDSVNHELTGRGVAVNVSQVGIRQRLEGGVITPKNARALTIPINARAHGKRAREFSDTFILDRSKTGDPETVGIIMQDLGNGQLDPLYVLRTRAEQAPDPDVLPKPFFYLEAISTEVVLFVNRLLNRS